MYGPEYGRQRSYVGRLEKGVMQGLAVSLRVLVLVALVAVGGTAAAATIVAQDDPNPITGVEGELTASDNISVTNQGLEYAGTNVTAVNLTVDNAASTEVSGTAHVAIYDSDGSVVATTEQDIAFASGTTTVEVDLLEEPAVENVVTIEVTIEETT